MAIEHLSRPQIFDELNFQRIVPRLEPNGALTGGK